jgi:hypothetical protein
VKLLPSLLDALLWRADAVGEEDCADLCDISVLVVLPESRVEQEHLQVSAASLLPS